MLTTSSTLSVWHCLLKKGLGQNRWICSIMNIAFVQLGQDRWICLIMNIAFVQFSYALEESSLRLYSVLNIGHKNFWRILKNLGWASNLFLKNYFSPFHVHSLFIIENFFSEKFYDIVKFCLIISPYDKIGILYN